jgi:hypothetical protein
MIGSSANLPTEYADVVVFGPHHERGCIHIDRVAAIVIEGQEGLFVSVRLFFSFHWHHRFRCAWSTSAFDIASIAPKMAVASIAATTNPSVTMTSVPMIPLAPRSVCE